MQISEIAGVVQNAMIAPAVRLPRSNRDGVSLVADSSAVSQALATEERLYKLQDGYRAVAGPPIVGFTFIIAGFIVIGFQLAGVLNLLSCGGGLLVFVGLVFLLIGSGVGLLVHPTVLVVADVLGVVTLVLGIASTGSGHC
jgi:hypothetical protein